MDLIVLLIGLVGLVAGAGNLIHQAFLTQRMSILGIIIGLLFIFISGRFKAK